jgi:hypothetical protein
MIELQEEEKETQRPELLKILCILTFVGTGLSLFSDIIMFFTIDIIKEYFNNGLLNFLSKDMDAEVLEIIFSVNSSYFVFQGIIFTFTLYGTYLMWNLKKTGFHIYTIGQIVLLIIPQVFIPSLPFPTFNLLISLIFIFLYAKNLKYLT